MRSYQVCQCGQPLQLAEGEVPRPQGRQVLPEAGRGSHVDFAAPGADMAGAGARGGYVAVRGTSFAAPVIAGIAARMLSDRPTLTPQQLESWITSTPSRIEDTAQAYADGKVAYVRSVASRVVRTSSSVAVAIEPIR